MDNFGERFEYDEFMEKEDMTEEFQRDRGEEYVDMIHEQEMNDFIEHSLDNQIIENPPEKVDKEFVDEEKEPFPQEYFPIELKEDSFEAIESVQEPIPKNNAERSNVREFPPNLNEISENNESVPDKTMRKEYLEWEEGDDIIEEDLPTSPFLKPIDKKEELYREIGIKTDEEKEAYWEFIHQTMNNDHKVIMDIPVPKDTEFWPPIETGESISFPFSSMDYQRERPPFDKYHWRVQKVYEKVKDLGIDYSSVSDEEGRKNIHQRYKNLVAREFKDQADQILETYKKYPETRDKTKVFRKLADLHSKITRCNDIWNKYSTWK